MHRDKNVLFNLYCISKISYLGYAILQLPEFCRAVWLRIGKISIKKKSRYPSENSELKNVDRNVPNNTTRRDLENKKTGSDIQQYIRTRIQIIHNFQQNSANDNADNEEQPAKLAKFLVFEMKALRRLMEEN